jgi:hypothetical protein
MAAAPAAHCYYWGSPSTPTSWRQTEARSSSPSVVSIPKREWASPGVSVISEPPEGPGWEFPRVRVSRSPSYVSSAIATASFHTGSVRKKTGTENGLRPFLEAVLKIYNQWPKGFEKFRINGQNGFGVVLGNGLEAVSKQATARLQNEPETVSKQATDRLRNDPEAVSTN